MSVLKKTAEISFREKEKTHCKGSDSCEREGLENPYVSFSYGSVHDFKLLCESSLHFLKDVVLIADKGYLGINKIHSNSLIPKKSTKKHKLTKEEKKYNSIISKRRIYIEHVNRCIKKFKIVSGRYRNKRKKFFMRFSLICAIYNFEL